VTVAGLVRGADRLLKQLPDSLDMAITTRIVRVVWTLIFALVIGTVFGPVSWYAHDHLDGLPGMLGDSAAVWLAIAFLAGWWATNPSTGALAGLLALGWSVVTYYAAQRTHGDWVEGTDAVQYWQVLAAVTGPVMGALGAAARTGSPRARGFALAAVGAAGLAEAVRGMRSGAGEVSLFGWEALVAVLLPLALTRHRKALVAAVCWLPVLTVLALPVLSLLLHSQHDGYLASLMR
jgi:hypothetical protein